MTRVIRSPKPDVGDSQGASAIQLGLDRQPTSSRPPMRPGVLDASGVLAKGRGGVTFEIVQTSTLDAQAGCLRGGPESVSTHLATVEPH